MRTFIYKRTHIGDPDPTMGVFGNHNCMGEERSWDFDAVIGVGGISSEPKRHGIAGKLTWIGIDPQKFGDVRHPLVMFDHFLYFEDGVELEDGYPALARHMYETNRRHIIHEPSLTEGAALDHEVAAILHLAQNAPPSRAITDREVRKRGDKCRAHVKSRRPS